MRSEGYTLKELNNREKMDFSGFIKNLKTHEMQMKVREEREPPKKAITFRASPSTLEEDSIDENEEEDFAMLIRKVARCSILREEGATLEGQNQKAKMEGRKKKWVNAIIAKRRDT